MSTEEKDLWSLYLAAQYVVLIDPPTEIALGAPNPMLDQLLEQHKSVSWALITAYNPNSALLSAEENRKRNEALEEIIKSMEKAFFHAEGRDRNGEWPSESSYLVLDLDLDEANQVALSFNQKAILFGTRGREAQLIEIVC